MKRTEVETTDQQVEYIQRLLCQMGLDYQVHTKDVNDDDLDEVSLFTLTYKAQTFILQVLADNLHVKIQLQPFGVLEKDVPLADEIIRHLNIVTNAKYCRIRETDESSMLFISIFVRLVHILDEDTEYLQMLLDGFHLWKQYYLHELSNIKNGGQGTVP